MTESRGSGRQKTTPDWTAELARFSHSQTGKALWQVVNTFVPLIVLWTAMVYTVHVGWSYWTTLALAIIAAGLQVRVFIIFHDACHGSFFASRRANLILGYVTGILTFTPFEDWRHAHNVHHATSGNLDRRGIGDVWTMTVAEYLASPRRRRLGYRLYRNPIVMFGFGAIYLFLVSFRIPRSGSGRAERSSVILTDVGIVAVATAASFAFGPGTYLAIQIPVFLLSGAVGVWLFYVQHQFEGTYWERHERWDAFTMAMEGSSFLKLPKVLQWFTGNIGLHHIHHMRPRIPNYRLQRCLDEVAPLRDVPPLTFRASLGSLRRHLWDERSRELVSPRRATSAACVEAATA